MMPSRAFKNDIEIRKRQIDTLKIFNDKWVQNKLKLNS